MIQVHDLHKHFGGFRAVDGASLTIEKGSITGLIGPNGAGKSTLFNVIAGVLKPTSGHVTMAGEDITGLPPHELFHKGLLRTFQLAHEFSSMTVRENLMMVPGAQCGETLVNTWFRRGRIREEERALRKKADEVLEFLTISHVADEKAGNLSGGQKKLLELGRTMMVDARIVFLDEVGAGVNRTLLGTIGDAIVRLNKERGYTFCVIEHDMDFIGRLCDPVIVMAAGKVLAQGSADSIMKNEAVIEAYLGTGLKNKVAAEVAEEAAFGESHGAQPGLGAEAGRGGDGKPAGDM
ncbi:MULTISPECIES: ABC transporter ATP-binding protein [Paracoccus]|jgi:branched-chain amino acid transport system ATP-binding protein|nr:MULTISPECIES: ABC transporter ATP-binding protein [Paracoccus]MBB4626099.1 branched-chain amino acid transport system ATP-binding protein [Paracoccus denitrificans]MCU7426742.1 ABC transporter ATP-binding protein [Paracoccus denitrificans]QAR28577.1 ABC transporter ATP-binding protein [Paracoccus denitrificans]UFS66351.1 ABC transporter ATP-binding protein [Paracoccus denitrificans]UPV96720.1 ABC transporter ATP-binding protein [Paracoccus denitrificans]